MDEGKGEGGDWEEEVRVKTFFGWLLVFCVLAMYFGVFGCH